MIAAEPQFRIVVYNAALTAIGEIITATSLNTKVVLDEVGTLSFSAPASDTLMAQVDAGSSFDVWTVAEGFLGRYVFQSSSLDEKEGVATRTIQAWSNLIQLSRATVGFHRKYSYHPIDQVVRDVIWVSGWTADVDTGLGYTTATFEGNSPLDCISKLADNLDLHYRIKQGESTIIEFGAFEANSGVTLQRQDANLPTLMQTDLTHAIVDSIRWSQDGEDIWNRIIAVGAGQGQTQTTMQGATVGTYALLTGTNQDGSLYYYIEDTTSIALYGLRVKVVTITEARPPGTSSADILNAANQLKIAAETYLNQHKQPVNQYDVVVRRLPTAVTVGDFVRLTYRGVVNDNRYLNVDGEFYVIQISRQRSAGGDDTASLQLTDVNRRPVTDQATMTSLASSVQAVKNGVQPVVSWYPFFGVDYVQEDVGFGVKYANFPFTIADDVMNVFKAVVHFQTSPAYSVFQGSTSIPAPGGAGTLLEGNFFLCLDDQYPNDVELWFDGTDISASLGGPWAVGPVNTPLDVTVDITSALLAAPTLRATHTVQFRVGSKFGDNAVPGYTANNGNGCSRGYFQCAINALVQAQSE